MNPSNGSNRLNIELGSPINVQFPSEDIRFPFFLIGMDIDRTLIAKPQPSPVLNRLIVEGREVIIRYLSFGRVFGFRSCIQGHIVRPFRMVFLSYPEKLETINLRRKERIYCFLPAYLTIDGASVAGMVVDLSEGGCRWVCQGDQMGDRKAPNINASIQMAFPLPGECGVMQCMVIVRNISQEAGQVKIGLSFFNLEPESLKKIQRYVTEAKQFQQGIG
ncbi:flagellar brake protein [Desulfatirhabdium butyrativorans]|uniref:flagellar brake protein n=1 Tax=Desulfatirhabdium butyrativorans TaxID=340467 RepID=UPI000400C181|nr:flagellar brake protein [Desulfatirhabdium butyrativorans]